MDKEAKRLYDAKRYLESRERSLERSKKWYEENQSRKQAYDVLYREVNRDKVLHNKSEWQKKFLQTPEGKAKGRRASHKRNALKYAPGNSFRITSKDERRALARYRNSCAYCGARGTLHWDHVIPLSRGGRNSIGNLLPCCQSCNQNKNARTVMEWRLKRIISKSLRGLKPQNVTLGSMVHA